MVRSTLSIPPIVNLEKLYITTIRSPVPYQSRLLRTTNPPTDSQTLVFRLPESTLLQHAPRRGRVRGNEAAPRPRNGVHHGLARTRGWNGVVPAHARG